MTHGSMPARVQDADRALVAGDVPHVGRHHHRVHHQHRRPGRLGPGPGVGREVAPQPVHRHALDDLERRRHRAGLQAAVAQHFQAVLRGGHQPPHWPGYRRKVHHRRAPLLRSHQSPDCRRHHGTALAATYHRRLMANLINVERATRRLRHPHAARRRQPRRRRRRRDRRRRPQRRRQVHAAAGADRDPRSPTPAGSPTHRACRWAICARATTSTPAPPSVRSSSAAGPTTSGPPNPTRARSSSTCLPRSISTPTSHDLSGGERRRVALAAVLLAGHDVLVLDEPTNHLDVEVIGWLAEHLSARRAAGAGGGQPRPLVPRRGLHAAPGRCTTATVDAYDGGYAAYVLARAERMRLAAGTEARRRNLMRKELAWLRRGPPARTSKPKFRIQAANELIANEPPPRDSLVLQRFATTRLGKDVFDLHRVRLEVGDRVHPRQASTGRSGRVSASGWSASTAPARRRCCGCSTGELQPAAGTDQARQDPADRLPEPGAGRDRRRRPGARCRRESPPHQPNWPAGGRSAPTPC